MRIFFAIPMYRGIAHPACTKSLEETLRLLVERGHSAILGACSGCCYIQLARSHLLRDFMQSDADTLFFIDDDVSWRAEDALKMIEFTAPVLAGIYPHKKDAEDYPVVVCTDHRNRAVILDDGTLSAFGVPAGMLRIRREVIEKLIEAHPEKHYFNVVDGKRIDGYYDLFPQGVYNERWVGEDFAFCQMWRDLGGRIAVMPNLNLSHHAGEKTWKGNYHEFLLRQPGGSNENQTRA